MSASPPDVNGLLDALGSRPDGRGTFVGQRVTDAIRRARYASVWRPLIERYVGLVDGSDEPADGGRSPVAAVGARLYCDLVCTVIAKKIAMVDVFYLYDPAPGENEEDARLRRVHTVTATKYLVKMATCAYECVYGRLPDRVDAANAAALLYAQVYAEAYDVSDVREADVFRLVEEWFRVHVLRTEDGSRRPLFANVAPGIPFLICSHVYWLWLHLTAARVRHSSRDLLTLVYALDTIVYCGDCKSHFLRHRSEYFVVRPDRDGEAGGCFGRYGNAELLFDLHNRVNAHTGSAEMDAAVLAEYKAFWEG